MKKAGVPSLFFVLTSSSGNRVNNSATNGTRALRMAALRRFKGRAMVAQQGKAQQRVGLSKGG